MVPSLGLMEIALLQLASSAVKPCPMFTALHHHRVQLNLHRRLLLVQPR